MFLIEVLETVATETQSMQKVCTHAYIGKMRVFAYAFYLLSINLFCITLNLYCFLLYNKTLNDGQSKKLNSYRNYPFILLSFSISSLF